MPLVIFIVGPTAIGKTSLSLKIAKRLNGEIVSSDSMQVYKGMDILSQAPRPSDSRIKHHLVRVITPGREYSAASFSKSAAKIIASIIKHGKTPVVVGGSGLYIKALVDGLFPSPPADEKFRKKMYNFASKYGSKKLHKKLFKIDPQSAGSIHPNDSRRIIRALELYNSTGRTMTELKKSTKGLKDLYDIKIFGLTAPREKIYANINSRVDEMFTAGVIKEVRALRKRKMSKTAGAVLGLKEISGYLDGEYGLEEANSMMKINTRHFAKRQLTWFKADLRIKWFDISRYSHNKIVRKILTFSTL